MFYLYLYVLWGEYGVGCVSTLARFKCAHVFAARKVHWTLRLSGSALRIAFARYALSAKAGLAPAFVVVFAQMINKLGKIFL
ncbi:hypothetical protein AM507_03160 [Gardnerella vaginalis]|nr:hypothetical protein AM507_03160 [Gardnerella vaginalis]